MARKLFCQISPLAYRISAAKCRATRRVGDFFSPARFARARSDEPLGARVCVHSSLIRRALGNTDMRLQENKAVNLALAAPKVNGVLIRPGETFSFWRLIGRTSAAAGYREGLTISDNRPSSGIGGGLCQLSNLIHWMVLHSPLTVTERHHHDQIDLFPDYNRQLPFGVGTSVAYNYLDYRFRNDTGEVYQLFARVDGDYLRGELRASRRPARTYHIRAENEFFSREGGVVYRNGEVWRDTIDPVTGRAAASELLQRNHARVAYDAAGLDIRES